jgi:cytochrome c553
LLAAGLSLGAGAVGYAALGTAPGGGPARAGGESIEVKLCDDETTTTMVLAAAEPTREEGQKVADSLMAQWRVKNPDRQWIEVEQEKHKIVPPADNSGLVGDPQGQTYGLITKEDVLIWERENLAMATRGSEVFHDGNELGSSIAVSCDMCHPDAANTHPETYPKYQVQLGRTVLLRDMINWCIEHPVRGQPLAPDDPRMRALEAYILAQRKGATLEYGKR